MTWYVTDVEAYIAARKAIGAAYVDDRSAGTIRRWRWSRSCAWSSREAMVEIETTAVVPE